MNENDAKRLERQFNAAFYVPAKFNWQSKRAPLHWIEHEHLQTYLTGPIYSIVHDGNCDYVYHREDDYFRDVGNPPALRNRLLQWHSEMAVIIESFDPTSPAESADLFSMRQFASDMRNVIEAACAIEQRRWESLAAR